MSRVFVAPTQGSGGVGNKFEIPMKNCYHGVDRKCTAKTKSEIPSFQCWLVSLSFFLPSIHTLNEGVYRKKEKGEGH